MSVYEQIEDDSGPVIEISDEEYEEIKAKIAAFHEWALEHGYARKCPRCGDIVVEGDKRCRCGKIAPPLIITDADVARWGF